MEKENRVALPLILCFLLLFIDVKGANASARKLLTNINEDGAGVSMGPVHGSHSPAAPSAVGHGSAPRARGVTGVSKPGTYRAIRGRKPVFNCGRGSRSCIPGKNPKNGKPECAIYSRQGCRT